MKEGKMEKLCSECNNTYPEYAKFCPYCGCDIVNHNSIRDTEVPNNIENNSEKQFVAALNKKDIANLKEYLKALLSLEKERQVLGGVRINLKNEIRLNKIRTDKLKNELSIIKRQTSNSDNLDFNSFINSKEKKEQRRFDIGGFIFFLVLFLLCLFGVFNVGYDFLRVLLIIGCIVLGIFTIMSIPSKKEFQEIATKEFKEKERIISENNRKAMDLTDTSKKLTEINNSVSVDVSELENQLIKTTETLDKLYSLNIIYPKYRDFKMLMLLLEYLDSGRCYSLEGHEGAYNLLESELRWNELDVKLEEINSRLDIIIKNQNTLYAAIMDTNNSIKQMSRSINNIQQQMSRHNEIMEYNSKCTMNSVHVLTNYTIWRDLLS